MHDEHNGVCYMMTCDMMVVGVVFRLVGGQLIDYIITDCRLVRGGRRRLWWITITHATIPTYYHSPQEYATLYQLLAWCIKNLPMLQIQQILPWNWHYWLHHQKSNQRNMIWTFSLVWDQNQLICSCYLFSSWPALRVSWRINNMSK